MAGLIATLLGTQQRVQFIQSDTGTVVTLDASISETHKRESPPTEFPVEDGTTISDHIIIKPFELEIQGMISDTPIKLLNSVLTTAAGVALPASGLVGVGAGLALFNALAGSGSPSVSAYGQLLLLQEGRKAFDVLTTLKRYTGMFIKSISVPRDVGTGRALIFTVSLGQLLIVKPQTVNIQIFQDSDLSSDQANLGKQQESGVDPLQQGYKDTVSFAKKIGLNTGGL